MHGTTAAQVGCKCWQLLLQSSQVILNSALIYSGVALVCLSLVTLFKAKHTGAAVEQTKAKVLWSDAATEHRSVGWRR